MPEIRVTFEWQGSEGAVLRPRIVGEIADHLAQTLSDDFGPPEDEEGRADGYDGPFVSNVEASANEGGN